MKNIFKFLFSILFLFSSAQLVAQEAGVQTEEYAIISVFQRGKNNLMSTTIGSKSTDKKEFEKVATLKKYDMAPVIAEMERLNKMGYTLFSSSTSMITIRLGNIGLPYYTFVFIKKKN